MKDTITTCFQALQDSICSALEVTDGGAKFHEDRWERAEGGGGITRIIQRGSIIEKGGVLFSAVHGKTPASILKSFDIDEADFFATGVSIVIHPKNPFVPIVHMNVRYFEMSNGVWWFGGGIDLTPHYIDIEDARFFHGQLKKVCDAFDSTYYHTFKNWADDYFFIKHRNETRGIGGIFFDRLSQTERHSKQDRWEFVKAVGNAFAPIYTTLMRKNAPLLYTESHKQWQYLRRSRYVEFNLVYDAGTKFGLETNGRTESILMSMPPIAAWEYNYQPTESSEEYKTLQSLRKGIDWLIAP